MPQTIPVAGLMVRTLPLVLLLAALLAWWLGGRLAGKAGADARATRMLVFDAVLVGVLAARGGHLLGNWEAYRALPWTALYLWRPGYAPLAGTAAGVAFAIWRLGRAPASERIRRLGALVGASAAAGVIAGAGALTLTLPAPSARWADGQPIDDFRLQDVDGRAVRFSDLAGRPRVLNFWATWCPPCRREMPLLDAAARRHREHRLAVIGIDLGESAARVREFVARAGIGYPQWVDAPAGVTGFDRGFDLHSRVGAAGVPATLFIDRRGVLVSRYIGELSAGTLEQRIAEVLDADPAQTAEAAAGRIGDQ